MRLPTQLTTNVPTDDDEALKAAASSAVAYAIEGIPRSSGNAARDLRPIWGVDAQSGESYIGIAWDLPYIWAQEMGINPFTMDALAGKVIPMWVSDEDGELRKDKPDIEQRTREDGQTEVLIFRRAANKGERKTVMRRINGRNVEVSVPKSYPGAPGRINRRDASGRIASGNVGVRWRHPGIGGRGFLHEGIQAAMDEREWSVEDIRPE